MADTGVRRPGFERVREPKRGRRGGANPVPSGGDVQLSLPAQCNARDDVAGTPAPPSGVAPN